MRAPVASAAPPELELALRSLWVGVDEEVPLASGARMPYVNFDNAASTPALRVVRDKVDGFLDWYASVHRGAGFKSRLATAAYEEAREVVREFVGADPDLDRVVFTKHTTESINVLATALPFGPSDVVAVSAMEHHSNQLPWRRRARIDYVEVDAAGRLDLDSLEDVLRRNHGSVRLVALTAASNVTGFVNPIAEAARLAHRFGARILVDAAQLVAHRALDMRPHDDPAHLDFVVFSGHKIYAPYGAGVLVAPRAVLEAGEPMLVGGGAIKIVTRDEVVWDDAPYREEAGSPNVVGAVALAVAVDAIGRLGFDLLEQVEGDLTRRALVGLAKLPSVSILGGAGPTCLESRLGVVSFVMEGVHHSLLAAVLANEWGVGIRNGCFCAHPYVMDLLGVGAAEAIATRDRIVAGDRRDVPGAARVSFAPYNLPHEVDRFLEGMDAIAAGRIQLRYQQDPRTGDHEPVDWTPDWFSAFSVRGPGIVGS